MTKFLSYGLVFIVAALAIFALSFYNIWAWTSVAEWYWSNYLTTHTGWAMPAHKTIIAVFLAISVLYWAVFGVMLHSIHNKVSKKEDWTDSASLAIGSMITPWFIEFCLWIYASWFNL